MSDTLTITTLTEWGAAIRLRDGSCQKCGATSNLHAHHIMRKSKHPELALDLSNGITLCGVCHAKEHESDFPHLAIRLATRGSARGASFTKRKSVKGKRRGRPSKYIAIEPPVKATTPMTGIFTGFPDAASKHAPHPNTVRDLVKRIDKSQQWIANRIGISERRLRYLIAGTREIDGKVTEVLLTYPEQFALEELASAAEVMRMKTDDVRAK